MRSRVGVEHRFVTHVPDELEKGVLYISIEYATTMHKCFCGCGREVVAPLSPTDWQLGFDGETVSLKPSIGNWSFPCESHYVIKRGEVRWARKMSRREIDAGRSSSRKSKQPGFEHNEGLASGPARVSWLRRTRDLIRGGG